MRRTRGGRQIALLFFPALWYSVFLRLLQRRKNQPLPEAKRLFLGLEASMKTLGSLIRGPE